MFNRARLKLTLWYLAIIMCVSISFSAIIFEVITQEVERFNRNQQIRIERRQQIEQQLIDPELRFTIPPPSVTDIDLVGETKYRITMILLLVNGGILLFAGGLGYLLAGQTLKPIKDMVDEQNRFISDASHELRTPLTSLKAAMEVTLRDKNLSIDTAKTVMVENIEEVDKLQSLSEELLQIAQYQKPSGNLIFETVSLSQIITNVIRKMKPIAQQKNITINVKTSISEIEANKFSIADLLTILLDNALKYSHPKSNIDIQARKDDGFIAITVKDEGLGIDKKDIPHIFDRFYRADAARSKSDHGGYGLGLAIAKQIVAVHHGSIKVESELKKGTIFTVRLPARQLKKRKDKLFSIFSG